MTSGGTDFFCKCSAISRPLRGLKENVQGRGVGSLNRFIVLQGVHLLVSQVVANAQSLCHKDHSRRTECKLSVKEHVHTFAVVLCGCNSVTLRTK
jgi:hypothetical protein